MTRGSGSVSKTPRPAPAIRPDERAAHNAVSEERACPNQVEPASSRRWTSGRKTPKAAATARDRRDRNGAKTRLTHCSKYDDYSITSSARARIDCGTVSPSTYAALRLITSSYLVGAWQVGGLLAFEDHAVAHVEAGLGAEPPGSSIPGFRSCFPGSSSTRFGAD